MPETSKMNPLVAIAAISVILFSIVGVGVMTGIVPSSFSSNRESTPQTGSSGAGTAKAVVAEPAPAPEIIPAPAPSKPKPQPKRAETKQPAQVATQAPVQTPPAPVAEPPKAAPVPICRSCGVVASINAIEQKGEGSGLGVVAGGILGGVLGHQIGGGTGKKIATVAGAAGGAYAGHQVEKNVKSTTRYDVVVNMDDGSTQTFSYDMQPAFQVGGKVRVVNGALTAG